MEECGTRIGKNAEADKGRSKRADAIQDELPSRQRAARTAIADAARELKQSNIDLAALEHAFRGAVEEARKDRLALVLETGEALLTGAKSNGKLDLKVSKRMRAIGVEHPDMPDAARDALLELSEEIDLDNGPDALGHDIKTFRKALRRVRWSTGWRGALKRFLIYGAAGAGIWQAAHVSTDAGWRSPVEVTRTFVYEKSPNELKAVWDQIGQQLD